MFRINEFAGSLIKSGRFKEAIDQVYKELKVAFATGIITTDELLDLIWSFNCVLLNPSDFVEVQRVGDAFLQLAIRNGLLPSADKEEFEKNLKESRG